MSKPNPTPHHKLYPNYEALKWDKDVYFIKIIKIIASLFEFQNQSVEYIVNPWQISND